METTVGISPYWSTLTSEVVSTAGPAIKGVPNGTNAQIRTGKTPLFVRMEQIDDRQTEQDGSAGNYEVPDLDSQESKDSFTQQDKAHGQGPFILNPLILPGILL
jgi:hypothetical protein